jgi:dihydropyrimidine dehydrogenase (NAD+) subunit PreT
MERTTSLNDAGIDAPGIVAGRLAACDYAARFSDSHPPLNAIQAQIEAERCYYCFDAPCTHGLPDEHRRAAVHPAHCAGQPARRGPAILEANPLGGMCARVCPTENAVRAGLRAQHQRRQAGRDRLAAALCHRRLLLPIPG